jgi:hypothetical protein
VWWACTCRPTGCRRWCVGGTGRTSSSMVGVAGPSRPVRATGLRYHNTDSSTISGEPPLSSSSRHIPNRVIVSSKRPTHPISVTKPAAGPGLPLGEALVTPKHHSYGPTATRRLRSLPTKAYVHARKSHSARTRVTLTRLLAAGDPPAVIAPLHPGKPSVLSCACIHATLLASRSSSYATTGSNNNKQRSIS